MNRDTNTCESNQHEDEHLDEIKFTRPLKIRLQLDNTFNLLEQVQNKHKPIPKYSTKDVIDEEQHGGLLKEDHHLVGFNIFSQSQKQETETHIRSRVLIHHSKYPPVNMIAHSLLESKLFKGFIVVLTTLNFFVQLVDAEFYDNLDPRLEILHVVLESLKWFILEMFFLEILLKWLDDFRLFWKSPWNIADFAVTVLSVLPEVIPESSEDANKSLNFLRLFTLFRVLRCLKMIYKIERLRFILITILRATKAAIQVIPPLMIVFCIFAMIGVKLFENYTSSTVQGLLYKDDFKDFLNSFATLFSIFTVDHWLDILKETSRVPELNRNVCAFFIMFWFLLAGLLLHNTFLGIMVDSFQAMRYVLSSELQQLKIIQRAEVFKARVTASRMEQSKMLMDMSKDTEEPSTSHEPKTFSSSSTQYFREEIEWERGVDEFILATQYQREYKGASNVQIWPEDYLFRYFELLEKLQHNLEEGNQLQDIAAQAFLNLHDS